MTLRKLTSRGIAGIVVLLFIASIQLTGQRNTDLFKTLPVINAATPGWAVEMYKEQPNVWRVDSLYEAYYRTHPFEKNTHTQNYKHWRRLVGQNHWIDSTGAVTIPTLVEQQAQEALWLKQRARQSAQRSVTGNWEPVGPFETWDGSQWISKQVNVYTIDQSISDPDIVYCGAETGGVYKSTDKGAHWTSIADDLILGGIGSVKVHPHNPDSVFVGQGNNLYRSVDGGDTWANVFSASSLNVRDILFVPAGGTNHMVILVACQQGLMRSTDGGTSWNFVSNAQCWDLELQPGTQSTVYLLQTNNAAQHIRFYRSVDKGVTFSEYNNGWYPGSMTYNNSTRGARMAVTPADSNYIYVALLGFDVDENDNNWIGVYKSTDGGTNWTLPVVEPGGPYSETHYCLTSFHPWFQWGGLYNQGYYDLAIAVSATDPEVLLVGSLNLFLSTDGAATYTGIGGYYGSISGYSHPDIQEIEINGSDVWVCTDGGVDLYNAAITSKVSLNNGINGSDYWGFDIGWNREIMAGGRYHNGNAGLHENYPEGKSRSLGGGEASTGYVNQGNSRKVYHSDVGGKLLPDSIEDAVVNIANLSLYPNESYTNENKGELECDPRCYNTLYLTKFHRLYKSENGGLSFEIVATFGSDSTKRATGFEISRSNPSVIYVCQRVTGEAKLWKTEDAGATWDELILPTTQTGGGIFITLDPTNADNLYLAVSNGGSNPNKIFVTTNGGDSWTNLTTAAFNGHYPEHLAFAGGTNGGVYVATNYTVFYRNNALSDWVLMDTGLPAKVQTMQMKAFYRDSEIRIATNRGIWSSPMYEGFTPVVQPTVDKRSGYCNRDTFYFEDYSMVDHDGTSWSWSFAPAPLYVNATNIRNPKVIFGADTTYDVTLELTTNTGVYSKTVPDMVTMENSCDPDTVPADAIRTFANGDYFISQEANLTNITHFTVTGWWKPNGSQQGFAALFSSGDWCAHCDYTEGLIFDYFGTRLWYKWPGNVNNWGSNSGMVIPLNEWSYIAMVIEPTGATLYLNGQKYVHNIPLNPGEIQNFYVGYGHYSHSFVGDIDEVTVWKRALSEAEIRALRHLTKEDVISSDPDLIAYYQFNTLVNDQILDHAGTHHGVLHNGAILGQSHAPIGGGSSSTQMVAGGGVVDFPGTGVSMQFPGTGTYPNGDLVVTRLNVPPDTMAYETPLTEAPYFIVNNYGSNSTFSELDRITFSGIPNVHPLLADQYSLYKRPSNAMGDSWGAPIDQADSADVGVVIFDDGNGISSFSQFTFGSDAPCVTVSNTNDDGPGSLRSAVQCAAPGGIVVFDPVIDGDTVVLSSASIKVSSNISIVGRGISNSLVSSALVSRFAEVRPGISVTLEGLTLIGGMNNDGRVIKNSGSLLLHNVRALDHPTLPNTGFPLLLNLNGGTMTIRNDLEVGN